MHRMAPYSPVCLMNYYLQSREHIRLCLRIDEKKNNEYCLNNWGTSLKIWVILFISCFAQCTFNWQMHISVKFFIFSSHFSNHKLFLVLFIILFYIPKVFYYFVLYSQSVIIFFYIPKVFYYFVLYSQSILLFFSIFPKCFIFFLLYSQSVLLLCFIFPKCFIILFYIPKMS